MIKSLLYFAFAGCCALSASGRDISSLSKINAAGRVIINQFNSGELNIVELPGGLKYQLQSAGDRSVPFVSAVVVLEEGYDSSVLDGLEVEIASELDGVLVVRCPLTVVEQIAEIEQVASIGFGDKLNPDMNFARPSAGIDAVQSGFDHDGKTLTFDGTGVVVGMMDTGLEANHINFKNADGSSRIKRLWHMNSNNGTSVEYTDQTISGFTTDTNNESHATHVAGILGGSYMGNATFKLAAGPNTSSISEQTNKSLPYYGVATGADLAFSVGELYTDNIIYGVTNIMDYAKSVGKPAVVNLSLGHVPGPHDGTDYYCQSLARLGKQGIICMSAGNDGDSKITITKTLTATNNALRTLPYSMNTAGEIVYGAAVGVMDIWASDDKPITLKLKAFNGSVENAIELMTVSKNGSYSTSSSSNFSTYFSGSVSIESALDRNNNRYEVYLSINTVIAKSGYVMMVEATSEAGTTLYAYGNNVSFYNKMSASSATYTDVDDGNADNSINDGACADNVLSVGAYTSSRYWGSFATNGAYYYPSGSAVDRIAPFSSYGKKFISATESQDLPLVSAPGTAIISSYSSYYLGSNTSSMCAKATNGSNTYYWGQMQGTSMSCPVVTGTIGLWLQAWPEMTFDDVMSVINKTSTYGSNRLQTPYNGPTTDKKKWGAGVLQALDGIKEVLVQKAAGIGEVWADDNQRLVITPVDGGYEVFVADATQLTATVYDLQGRAVATASSLDGTATVSTDRLAPGVYIIEARTPQLKLSRKVTR